MKWSRGLLVDLDGTLADTAHINYRAYAQALAEAGVVVSRDRFDAVAPGRNWRQFLPILLSQCEIAADPAAIAARKSALYQDLAREAAINLGLVRLLEQRDPACAAALVTTASRANAQALLHHHDLGRLFDLVVVGEDVTRHKPDPEAYVTCARKLELEPAVCVVFEDSDIGVASARSFGAAVVRVAPFG